MTERCQHCGETTVKHSLCARCRQDYIDECEADPNDTCLECGRKLIGVTGDLCRSCEFLEYECGMMADGTCMLAGSEECDWECPRGGLS